MMRIPNFSPSVKKARMNTNYSRKLKKKINCDNLDQREYLHSVLILLIMQTRFKFTLRFTMKTLVPPNPQQQHMPHIPPNLNLAQIQLAQGTSFKFIAVQKKFELEVMSWFTLKLILLSHHLTGSFFLKISFCIMAVSMEIMFIPRLKHSA